MNAAQNALQPREISRRHQALMAAFWHSRSAKAGVNIGPMAGAISAPVGPTTPVMRRAANSPPVETPAAAFLPGMRTVVSYAAAKSWAIGQGICKRGQPLDLRAVNELRRARGEPGFVLLGER